MSMSSTFTGVAPRRRIQSTRIFCVAVVGLFLLSTSVWHGSEMRLFHALTPMGIVLAVVGALGRLWCSSYAAGNKNDVLLTAGPYSVTRNPLYFFSYLGGLGVAITTETFTIPLLFTAWFAWYYRDVIRGEESHLKGLYGDLFESYRNSVPTFVPRFSGFIEPTRWEISPKAFRRSLSEVIWFAIAAILLHLIHDLRGVETTMSLLTIP